MSLAESFVLFYCKMQETQVSSDLEYLVLATDGLWDVVQNEVLLPILRF